MARARGNTCRHLHTRAAGYRPLRDVGGRDSFMVRFYTKNRLKPKFLEILSCLACQATDRYY